MKTKTEGGRLLIESGRPPEAKASAKEMAKMLVEYHERGGSAKNAVNLMEGKSLDIETIRDFADVVQIEARRAGAAGEKCFIDPLSGDILLESKEAPAREAVQRLSDALGVACRVTVGKRTRMRLAYPGGIGLEKSRKNDDGTRDMVESIVDASPVESFATSDDVDRLVEAAATMTPKQIAERFAIPYALAKQVCQKAGGPARPAVPCPLCASDLKTESKSSWRCPACDFKGKVSGFIQEAASKAPRCSVCGSFTESRGARCQCGFDNRAAKSLTESAARPTSEPAEKPTIVESGCPSCKGTAAKIADSWTCLECRANLTENQVMSLFSRKEEQEYTVEPSADRYGLPEGYSVESEDPAAYPMGGGDYDMEIAEQDDEEEYEDEFTSGSMEEQDDEAGLPPEDADEYGYAESVDPDMDTEARDEEDYDETTTADAIGTYPAPFTDDNLPPYGVVIAPDDSASALEYLRDSGMYAPGQSLFESDGEGWGLMEGEPSGETPLMVAAESEEDAGRIRDALTAQGIESEVEEFQKEEKMSYHPDRRGEGMGGGHYDQGSTFDYARGSAGAGPSNAPWNYSFYGESKEASEDPDLQERARISAHESFLTEAQEIFRDEMLPQMGLTRAQRDKALHLFSKGTTPAEVASKTGIPLHLLEQGPSGMPSSVGDDFEEQDEAEYIPQLGGDWESEGTGISYHLRDPKSYRPPLKFKTLTKPGAPPVKLVRAKVAGSEVPVKLVFMKDDWTLEDAKAWVKKHRGKFRESEEEDYEEQDEYEEQDDSSAEMEEQVGPDDFDLIEDGEDDLRMMLGGDSVLLSEKWEETENEIRHRIRDPKGYESFSYKWIKPSKPIALLIGRKGPDESEVQALRFPRKHWDLSSAKEWVSAHGDELKEARG